MVTLYIYPLNYCILKSKPYSQEQLNLVLEDSASEDEDNDMSGGDRPAAAETDGKKSNAVARRERCDSPDFHGFESWAEEAEYIKSLEGFRRDKQRRHKTDYCCCSTRSSH